MTSHGQGVASGVGRLGAQGGDLREFMLLSLEAQATADALAKLPAYVKLKAFDDQIAALRAIIRGTA